MESRLLNSGEIHRADALDGDLAALALDVLEADDAGVEAETAAGVAALERDQELMAASRGIAERQDQIVFGFGRLLDRAAVHRLQLIAGGEVDGHRAQLALRY